MSSILPVTAGVAFDKARITIASTTFDIVGFPPVRIQAADLRPKAR